MAHLAEFAGHMLTFMLAGTAGVLVLSGICRWLRARGHGPTLEAIARWHGRMSLLGALHSLHALRAIQSLPLYGSRRQRDAIDTMIAQVQREAVRNGQAPKDRV